MGSSEIITIYPIMNRIMPAFSSRPLTAEAMVLSQASQRAISGGQRGTGARFSCQYHSTYRHHITALLIQHTSLSLSLSRSTPKSWCPSSHRRALDRTIKIKCHLSILYSYLHICKHVWIQDERKLRLRTAECDRPRR